MAAWYSVPLYKRRFNSDLSCVHRLNFFRRSNILQIRALIVLEVANFSAAAAAAASYWIMEPCDRLTHAATKTLLSPLVVVLSNRNVRFRTRTDLSADSSVIYAPEVDS